MLQIELDSDAIFLRKCRIIVQNTSGFLLRQALDQEKVSWKFQNESLSACKSTFLRDFVQLTDLFSRIRVACEKMDL